MSRRAPIAPGGPTGPSHAVRSPARLGARSLPARDPPMDSRDDHRLLDLHRQIDARA